MALNAAQSAQANCPAAIMMKIILFMLKTQICNVGFIWHGPRFKITLYLDQ